jgi:hypothetical protein
LAFSGISAAAITRIVLRRKNFVMVKISFAAIVPIAVHLQNALWELLFRWTKINYENFQVRTPVELATTGKIGVTRGKCPVPDIIDLGQCNSAITL